MEPKIIALGCLLFVTSFILFINGSIFCYQSITYIAKAQANHSFVHLRNLGLTNILCDSLFMFCWGSYYMSKLNSYNNSINSLTEWIFFGCGELCWCAAMLAHSLFLIEKLRNTFKETAYKVQHRTIALLWCTAIFAGIGLGMVCLVTLAINWSSYHTRLVLFAIICIPFWSILVATQIIVANLFSQRLMQITLSIRETQLGVANINVAPDDVVVDCNNINSIEKTSIVLSNRQEKLLNTIAKQTLLSRIDSTTLMIAMISWIFNLLFGSFNNKYSIGFVMWFITLFCFMIYVIAISMTVWFSFIFAQKEYYFCCEKCHQFCLSMYQQKAIVKISHLSQSLTHDIVINSKSKKQTNSCNNNYIQMIENK